MFQNINEIESIRERKFFIEKVNLFNRLISLYAKKNNIKDLISDSKVHKTTIERLKELSIISSDPDRDHRLLIKTLKKPVYIEFISAINFNIQHREQIGPLLDNLDPSKRKLIQEKAQNIKGPKIIDFFCGAGGLSLGFSQEGFKINLANDFEDVCIETFKYNHPEVPDERIIFDDIRNITNNIEEFLDKEIDVVVGGPPCQGFSSANQQRIIDDPRNELYKYFIKAIEKIAPKFVVMENVKGMLSSAEQIVEDYNNINAIKGDKSYSYITGYKILVSDDFSVAQRRQRLIFIAVRNDIAKSKKTSPLDIFQSIEENNKNTKQHVLKDALEFIKPLEAPRIKNMTEVDDETTGKKLDVSQYKGNENSYLRLINQNREIKYLYNHKARYTNDINYEIYATLEQGDDGTNDKIKHIMPYKHRNHIFKDKYFKLIEDRPSRTITAHLRMDCHSHIHPTQIRSITPREAARIQSFPDDYVFLGPYLKTYMQIGNAVPPVMARGIAKVIKKYL